MKTCTVERCDKKHHAKGYCRSHWNAERKYGTAKPTAEQQQAMRKKLEPRAPQPERVCCVPECGRMHKAKGYCRTHYMRLFCTGEVRPDEPITIIDPDPLRRMASHLVPEDDEHPYCWVWTGIRDKDGYGRVTVGGRGVQAHRRMYELLTSSRHRQPA